MDSVSDELWTLVEPLLPPRRPAVHGRTGRPRLDDRAALEGVVFVLRTGIGWAKLSTELGYGSGWTSWRRLREWQDAGAWEEIDKAVLDELARRGQLDWSRCSIDSVSVRAKRGAQLTGPNPTDRGKRGSPYYLLVDRAGTPLNVVVSGANRYDSIFLEPVLDSMPAMKVGGRGHPRRRPVKLHADKGYDNGRCRA